MKIVYEREEGESSAFSRAEFFIDIDNGSFYSILLERTCQFLYPFVDDMPNVADLFLEITEGRDAHQMAKCLELDRWGTDDLLQLAGVVQEAINRMKITQPTTPQPDE